MKFIKWHFPICIKQCLIGIFSLAPYYWIIGFIFCLINLANNNYLLNLYFEVNSSSRLYDLSKRINLNNVYSNTNLRSLLYVLGFRPDPIIYPNAFHSLEDLPVFILPLGPEDIHNIYKFLGNFRFYFNDKKLVIYDLGLNSHDLEMIRNSCQCLIRKFHNEKYPIHVQNRLTKAYLPLLIQETLQEFGMIFLCNSKIRFNKLIDFASIKAQVESLGILAWNIHPYPVTTFTKHSTFIYFNVSYSSYRFQKMVQPDIAIYANTLRLHYKLMLPWVACSLNPECFYSGKLKPSDISAEGFTLKRKDKYSSCKFSVKPWFKYSGCHAYGESIFNIILGSMFNQELLYLPEFQPFYLQFDTFPTHFNYTNKIDNKNIVETKKIKMDKENMTQTKIINNELEYKKKNKQNDEVVISTTLNYLPFPWEIKEIKQHKRL